MELSTKKPSIRGLLIGPHWKWASTTNGSQKTMITTECAEVVMDEYAQLFAEWIGASKIIYTTEGKWSTPIGLKTTQEILESFNKSQKPLIWT